MTAKCGTKMEGLLLRNFWRGNPVHDSTSRCHVNLSRRSELTGSRGVKGLVHQQWRRRCAILTVAESHGTESMKIAGPQGVESIKIPGPHGAESMKVAGSHATESNNRLADFEACTTIADIEEPFLYGPELLGFAHRVAACNRGHARRSEFLPFVVGSDVVGHVHHRFAQRLKKFSDVFSLDESGSEFAAEDNNHSAKLLDSPQPTSPSIALVPELTSPEDRTAAIHDVLRILQREGLIPGWRNESFPVILAYGQSPVFSMERAAVPFFGVKAYGVHMNGYVVENGVKHLWVARRSDDKPTYPGKLDHLVGGGNPSGISARDNLVKECEEEAGIPMHLAEKAVAVGAVSYEVVYGEALKRDVLFCYDLELPPDFEPFNRDGEVQKFYKKPVSKVFDIVKNTADYKPNCALVVIDFLIRHGYITPELKGYLSLLQSLRIGAL